MIRKASGFIAIIFATVTAAYSPRGLTAVIAQTGRNEIYGVVFNQERRPMPDIYVELLDDVGVTLKHSKTDVSGRFAFGSLPNGRYIVKTLPYGTEYLEQYQEVTLSAVSATAGSGSDTQHIE